MTHQGPSDFSRNTLAIPSEVAVSKTPARPAALTAAPGALSLLKALRRRWAAALGLGILLAGLVGAATYFLVPRAKYIASATLHVSTKPKRIMFDPQERDTDYKTYQKTQTTLLKNRKVLSHALTKPEVAGLATVQEQVDAEEWLDLNLKADFPGGSEVLLVTLSGDRPQDLAKIVNAVVKSYMTIIVEEEYRERVARLDALRKLREKYETELKLKRKSLRETVATVGLTDEKALAMSQQFKVEHLGMAQRELMRSQSELLKAKSELAVLEASPSSATAISRPGLAFAPGSPGTTAPSSPMSAMRPGARDDRIERHPRVLALKDEAAQIAQSLREGQARIRNSLDPTLKRLRSRSDDINRRLDEERQAVTAELAGVTAPPKGGMTGTGGVTGDFSGLSDLTRARSQVAVWRTYGEALTKDIQRLQSEVKDTTDKGLDLENEREEIATATDISRKVSAEVEAVQVELGAPERIQILAEAKIPNKKDELRKLKAGGGAALGALACALLGVSFWEYRNRRVDAIDEIVNGLGMRLVGTIPALPLRKLRITGTTDRGAEDRRWQSRLVESVDAMRAMLMHAARRDDTRVVMVSSALKGEGKTSLACHLATSLARGGRRTLLIDCDLRSPTCHRLFDLPVAPGLCEVLRGEIADDEAIHEGLDSSPSLLTAGRTDALALQCLAQDRLRHLLDELRGRFDFIVVDSAPVLPVADSLLVGQAVDAVIFSVMRDVSRLPMVYDAYERLSALGVRMIGAVVSGVQEAPHDYYYQSQLIA